MFYPQNRGNEKRKKLPLCSILISETIRLLKYVLYVLAFKTFFGDSYSAFSDYATNYTVITVVISQFQLLKQCGWNKLYHN